MQSTGTGRAWRPRGDKGRRSWLAAQQRRRRRQAGPKRRRWRAPCAGKSSRGTFAEGLTGVLVQPMVAGGTEVIIGVVREPVSGPVVVSGPGGVATEVLSDHSARLAPLTGAAADGLIRPVRAGPLLPGHRVAPAAGLTALSDTLPGVSRLAGDLSSRCGPPKRQLP